MYVGEHSSSTGLMISIPYTNDKHGRLIISKMTWMAFHIEENDIQVGQAVLITARTITCPILSSRFVVGII
jgi:hypothetical protein